VVIALFLLAGDIEESTAGPPPGLREGCSIVRRWLGVVPRIPYGMWAKCGQDEFFLAEPLSLLGYVKLRDAQEALRFVRFFSLPASAKYLRPMGMVEVVPAPGTEEFNSVSPARFRKLFHPPRVKDMPRLPTDSFKMYSIERVMLTPSNEVVDVTEMVGENGYYEIVSRRPLMRDSTKIGLYYLDH
jgi:hypothetical protein